MRPKKTRFIKCNPGERCFRPRCKSIKELDGVVLTIDEFEVLRLSHLEEFEQDKIAKQMKIHRSTVSRILTSAHKKITDALVNIKAIKVEGGCCEVIKK
ncbi:MAG: DUF134 domain-containing protein [Proteobacteria bacterium]|nr:DUF134 domain-containing protein [Pseudomonadota bacterium]